MLGEEKHHAPAAARETYCGNTSDGEDERKRQLALLCIELFLASRAAVNAADSPPWVN